MSNLGRPIEFDEVKKSEICALLSAGCSVQHAAQYVGCSARTIRRHAERDEPFRQRLRRAEASIRLTALETVRRAAATNWRTAIWLVKNGGGWEAPPDDQAARSNEMVEDILEELAAQPPQNGHLRSLPNGHPSGSTVIPLCPPRHLANGHNG